MFTGKKVYIRAIEEYDLPIIHKWNFDQRATEFFSPRFPNSTIEQKKWFEAQFSGNKKKLIIVEKDSDQPVGLLGIMQIDHLNKNCEVGITIGEDHYLQKGLAYEAMNLVLTFLFNQQNMHCVYLRVFENNTRAIKFFEKCGFKQDGVMRDMVFRDNSYISYINMSILKDIFNNE